MKFKLKIKDAKVTQEMGQWTKAKLKLRVTADKDIIKDVQDAIYNAIGQHGDKKPTQGI